MNIEEYLTGQAAVGKSIKAKTISTSFKGGDFNAVVTVYIKEENK